VKGDYSPHNTLNFFFRHQQIPTPGFDAWGTQEKSNSRFLTRLENRRDSE